MGQTRVDLLHLLEDLRDAYPGGLEETIVAETVANALDSGARLIAFTADPAARTLTILDDGRGMTRAQLRRYHDLAASTKNRGSGIGFAGVGIKLALLACDDVVTETRRAGRSHASRWHLASRQNAPWAYLKPAPGLVHGEAGTAVRLALTNPLSPLLDPGWLAAALVRGFEPLFDPTFDDALAAAYPGGVRFAVNGRTIPRAVATSARLFGNARLDERAPIDVRLPRKRKPSAVGWVARADGTLPEAERGIAISTLGKVIRRGWDWLGITAAAGDRITGLIEAPGLAETLQLNKADFIRTGARGAVYLSYRKALQEAVSGRLSAWGEDPAPERGRQPRTRRIERDLEHVLLDLADDYPLLGALVERRAGGQKRIPAGRPAEGAVAGAAWAVADALADATGDPAREAGSGDAAPSTAGADPAPTPREESEPAGGADESGPAATPSDLARTSLPGRSAGRKRGRYALAVAFEKQGPESGMARLVESTVLVNADHPAWNRAEASRAEGYHVALCVAMALAPLAADPAANHEFIGTFMARWGEAAGKGKQPRRRRQQGGEPSGSSG